MIKFSNIFSCFHSKTRDDENVRFHAQSSSQTVQSTPQRVQEPLHRGSTEMRLRTQLAANLTQGAWANDSNASFTFKVKMLGNSGRTGERIAIFGDDEFINMRITSQNRQYVFDNLDAFVRSSDGKVRRYPKKIDGSSSSVENQIRGGQIYDSDKKYIVRCVAEYRLDNEDATGSFVVDGIKQNPVFDDGEAKIYKLGQNRHMVPQPNFTSCTFACENMLLMDQGYLSPSSPIEMQNRRRNLEDLLDSIQWRSGVNPICERIDFELNKKNSGALSGLQEKIQEYGPCILDDGSHTRMLDKIIENNGKYSFEIRDPFHGTCNVVAGLKALFNNYPNRSENSNNQWLKVIFLPHKDNIEASTSYNS